MGASSNLILGTAGHIDHGKSRLILALTGTDPDRLAEEKKRGITIELGFAQLELPSGTTMGVVDVPGHERFIRHMVQGATGVDVALLVIAADDGVMPQTKEHLAVLQLLGVTSCVVALTKIDLVDEEWLAFIRDYVESRLSVTPFVGAPIVPCSAVTGAGLDELRMALDKAAAKAKRTKPEGAMRMPIDRVFTVKGFGTVVTGTLWSGEVHVGDELELLGIGETKMMTRVRSIQMHGCDYEEAVAGNRVAMSLAGLSTDDVHTGDFLTEPGLVKHTDRFDATFTYYDPFEQGKLCKSGTRVHICHGTREVLGRILCMRSPDGSIADTLTSGETTLVQIRLESALPVSSGDRFIVRSYSPAHVMGGGTVILTHPRRRTSLRASEKRMLMALAKNDVDVALDAWFEDSQAPARIGEIQQDTGLSAQLIESYATSSSRIIALSARDEHSSNSSTYYATPELLQKEIARIESALKKFHALNPQMTGISKDALRQQLDDAPDAQCFDALLAEAEARGRAIALEGVVSHPQAGSGARAAEQKALEKVAEVLKASGATPLTVSEFAAQVEMEEGVTRRALRKLAEEGRAIQVEQSRYYDAEAFSKLQEAVVTHIQKNGPSTAALLKEAMGITRKYAMPLLEYFDEQGITERDGDLRTLFLE